MTMELTQLVELANANDIHVDQLYIDRFWNNLHNGAWVNVDSQLLTWLGYESNAYSKGLKRIKDHLINTQDSNGLTYELDRHYKLLSMDAVDYLDVEALINDQAMLIEPRSFKKILMQLNMPRAQQIREYYLSIESLYIAFLQKCNQLNTPPKEAPLVLNECIYVISNEFYARDNIYKIGRTKALKKRLSSLNTSCPPDSQLKVIRYIMCYDSKSLEKMIHEHLHKYRMSDDKEWFVIKYSILSRILDLCESFSKNIIETINGESCDATTSKPTKAIKADLIKKIEVDNKVVAIAKPVVKASKPVCPHCKVEYARCSAIFDRHVNLCKSKKKSII